MAATHTRTLFQTSTEPKPEAETCDESMGKEDEEENVAALGQKLTIGNSFPKRSLRRITRTQGRVIVAAIQALEALANAKMAVANEELERASGVYAGLLSPTGKVVTNTREALDISLAALKAASDGNSRARERSHHALAVLKCAAGAMAKFIEDDDGCLETT